MASYEVLKNRLTNGDPYRTSAAIARIEALANMLELTEEQVEELTVLAQEHGSTDVATVEERLHALEAKALELETRDLEHDAAIMELAEMMDGGEA